MSVAPGGPDLASLSTLDDPARRRLYEIVIRHTGPAGRDDAASPARIGRGRAVHHRRPLGEVSLPPWIDQRPRGGVLRLVQRPVTQAGEQHGGGVGGVSLALVEALVGGLGTGGWRPVVDPRAGHGCGASGGAGP